MATAAAHDNSAGVSSEAETANTSDEGNNSNDDQGSDEGEFIQLNF
jgi:hypothetical protein